MGGEGGSLLEKLRDTDEVLMQEVGLEAGHAPVGDPELHEELVERLGRVGLGRLEVVGLNEVT